MLGKEKVFSPRRVLQEFASSQILSDVVMTISLYRANEFDAQMEGDGAFCHGSHVGLLEYSLCALLRQQYIRHFRFSALKPSTLMLGEKKTLEDWFRNAKTFFSRSACPTHRRNQRFQLPAVTGDDGQQNDSPDDRRTRSTSNHSRAVRNVVAFGASIEKFSLSRRRILDLFDQIANQCDVTMVVNVSAFSSMTSTYGRIQLIPPGYDALCRSVICRRSRRSSFHLRHFSWSYMFQIEECQVRLQYKSHCIEFHHHLEELQRFFLHQVRPTKLLRPFSTFVAFRSPISNSPSRVTSRRSSVGR